jgi:hypothetical protein
MSVSCQQETHAPQQIAKLFNHLVGKRQLRRRQGDPELTGCFQVDGELEFRWLLDREVGWPPAEQGMGAELHVARPPLLVRRWRADRSKRHDPSALRQPRDGKSGNGSSSPVGFSEPEAKANRGIDRVAMEEAVRQAAIDL